MNVLENELVKLDVGGRTITMMGVSDPSFNKESIKDNPEEKLIKNLSEMDFDDESYKIMLARLIFDLKR